MKSKLDKISVSEHKKREKIKSKYNPKNTIEIRLDYFYFPTIKTSFFTNFFINEESYFKHMSSFYHNMFSYLENKEYTEIEKNNSHIINESEKIRLINKIIDQYLRQYPKLPKLEDEMLQEFYQIAGQNGLRMIGTRYENIFYLLFLDPYHLIYKDDKFNLGKNAHKITSEDLSCRENLIILNADSILDYEECMNCLVLEKITKS